MPINSETSSWSGSPSLSRRLLVGAVVGVSLILIARYFLFHAEDMLRLQSLQWKHVLALFMIYTLFYILNSVKMFFILKKLAIERLTFPRWFKIFNFSSLVNYHIAQGANVYRAMALKRQFQFPITKYLGMVTFYSWFEIVVALALALAILPIFISDASVDESLIIVLGGMLIAIGLVPFVLALFPHPQPSQQLSWIYRKMVDLKENVRLCFCDGSLLGKLFFYSLLSFLLYVFQMVVAFYALNMPVRLEAAVLLAVIFVLSTAINITPNNIGLREVLYGYLTQHLGYSLGAGVLVSGLIRIVGYFVNLAFGIASQGKDVFGAVSGARGNKSDL